MIEDVHDVLAYFTGTFESAGIFRPAPDLDDD
jgi:hypothetical protein